jgi:hypothetical protein
VITFSADKDLTSAPRVGSVIGWHVTETAGAAANVALRNGSVTGPIIVNIRLPAVAGGNSVHVALARPALFPKGLFVDVVSGTVIGSIQPG